jgi:N-acetylglucosamine kinase-like BadF-type ATPase
MAIVVEVAKPVTAGGRSMMKYVYGALKGQEVPDEVIKKITKALQKWVIKEDLEEKEITFTLEVEDGKVKVRNVKIWQPVEEKDLTYELEI